VIGLTIVATAAADKNTSAAAWSRISAPTAPHSRRPEVHDGYDRLGMVSEARGDHKQAAHYYRQVIDFVRAHPDQYKPA
jgi:hypothetical protein